MELNQLENVKQKIVVLTQGELVAHAQKQVPLVRNPFSFIQLFTCIILLCQPNKQD
jgi:hypothetical protein